MPYAAQAYPKELMQCMLDVSSQTAEDPSYQRIVHLVKALVRFSSPLPLAEASQQLLLHCAAFTVHFEQHDGMQRLSRLELSAFQCRGTWCFS